MGGCKDRVNVDQSKSQVENDWSKMVANIMRGELVLEISPLEKYAYARVFKFPLSAMCGYPDFCFLVEQLQQHSCSDAVAVIET